jgi:hypothetical protein
MVDMARAVEFQARHLLFALESGDPYRIARGLCAEGLALAAQGGRSWARAQQVLEDASVLAKEIGDPHAIGLAELSKGMASGLQGHWRSSYDLLERARQTFWNDCTGVAWETTTAEHMGLRALSHLGELGRVQDRIQDYLDHAKSRGDLYASTLMSTGSATLVQLALDDPSSARAEVEDALRYWSQNGFHLQHYNALLAETSIDLYLGEGAHALRRLRNKRPALRRSLLLNVQQVRIEVQFLEARALLMSIPTTHASDIVAVYDAVEKCMRRIDAEQMAWAYPLSSLIGAGLALLRGDRASAIQHYEGARFGFAKSEMRLHAMVAQRKKGELIGGDEGASLVEAADEWMASQRIRRPQVFADMLAPSGTG